MKILSRLIVVALFLAAPPIQAQTIDTGKAQGAMHSRVSTAIEQLAVRIGASHELISYCQIEMGIHLVNFPSNGLIPFRVNYNNIRTERHLNMVINARGTVRLKSTLTMS